MLRPNYLEQSGRGPLLMALWTMRSQCSAAACPSLCWGGTLALWPPVALGAGHRLEQLVEHSNARFCGQRTLTLDSPGTRSVPETVSEHGENFRGHVFENAARNKCRNMFGNVTHSGTFSRARHFRTIYLFRKVYQLG